MYCPLYMIISLNTIEIISDSHKLVSVIYNVNGLFVIWIHLN